MSYIQLDKTLRPYLELSACLPNFQGVHPMTDAAAAKVLIFQCVLDGGNTEQECPRGANVEGVVNLLNEMDYEASVVTKGLFKKREMVHVSLRLSKKGKMSHADLNDEYTRVADAEYLRTRTHPSNFDEDHVPHERAARLLLIRLALGLGA